MIAIYIIDLHKYIFIDQHPSNLRPFNNIYFLIQAVSSPSTDFFHEATTLHKYSY